MIDELDVPDATASFLKRGFTFISWHCDQLGTDAFQARLIGRPTVFLRGLEAAELIYDRELFDRNGVVPTSAQHLLQDEQSVQTLAGAEHSHRKELFRAIGARHHELARVFGDEFAVALTRWCDGPPVVLYDELVLLLGRSVLRWAGIESEPGTERAVSRQLGEMVERAGSFGPGNWLARGRRRRTEAWARDVVRASRRRAESDGAEPSVLQLIVTYRDPGGEPLSDETAAIELLNVLRPVVANALFIAFAAMLLHQHPDVVDELRDDAVGAFDVAQEVRRVTPLFPAIGGTALQQCQWRDEPIAAGTRVLVDLYGTNQSPDIWRRPQVFDPHRFRDDPHAAKRLVPQGFGDVATGHRCPGEDISLALLATAIDLLARTPLELPAQDLSVDLAKMPALPRSRVVIRPTGQPAG